MRIRLEQYSLLLLLLILTSECLDAFSIAGIPIAWVAKVFLVIAVGLTFPLRRAPGIWWVVLLVTFGLAVTVFNGSMFDYARLMPRQATTPYFIYISLRFLDFAVFASIVALVDWMIQRGLQSAVERYLVIAGSAASAIAVYVYMAQVQGWPTLAYTRVGTGGGEVGTVFSYSFHRALGSFREPALLAEFLVAPFLLSLTGSTANAHSLLIGTALLLTGSMTGILGATIGVSTAVLLTNPFRSANLRAVCTIAAFMVVPFFLFGVLASPNVPGRVDLLGVIADRAEPLLESGLAESNRRYVYEYIAANPMPLFGYGFGHSNELLSHYLGNPLMVSFLSLYLNVAYSTGYVGLCLLAVLLLVPVPIGWRGRLQVGRVTTLRLAAYLAWLAMNAVHSEELRPLFACVFAIQATEKRRVSSR